MDEPLTPKEYTPALPLKSTFIALNALKDYLEVNLARELLLTRVPTPLFILPDDNVPRQIADALKKWSTGALKSYGFTENEGLYIGVQAVIPAETADSVPCAHLSEWHWEKIVPKADLSLHTLKQAVKKIYKVIKMCEKYLSGLYPALQPQLPDEIAFITKQELSSLYPDSTADEQAAFISRRHKAVFIINAAGNGDLSGDMMFYHPPLGLPLKISRAEVRPGTTGLPCTVGGALNRSLICMFMLRKQHIGEVQPADWPDDTLEDCRDLGIKLL